MSDSPEFTHREKSTKIKFIPIINLIPNKKSYPTHLAGLTRDSSSVARCRRMYSLDGGIPRAVANVSAVKVGSRTINAPWTPDSRRFSANSWKKTTVMNITLMAFQWFLYQLTITKTCLCNIKIIFSASNIESFIEKNDIFNNFAQNIYCGYTLEPPQRGGPNEYPQYRYMFWIKNKKNKYTPVNSSFTT